jgi:hypothetical protein
MDLTHDATLKDKDLLLKEKDLELQEKKGLGTKIKEMFTGHT